MRPILVTVGSTAILSHEFFVAVGAAVALFISIRIAIVRGRMSHELVWIAAAGLVMAAIFSRFGLAIRYALEPGAATFAGLLEYGGRTLLGGLVGAYLGVILMKRLIGYKRDTGDVFVPGVALGIAIGRIGCALSERPGTPTALPWGVHVAPERARLLPDCEGCLTGNAMHPSFLYESLFLAFLGWWLLRVSRRGLPAWMAEGDLFKAFLFLYAGFRFLVEYVRGNPEMLFSLSGSQLMVLPAFLGLAVYFARRYAAADRSLVRLGARVR
jgi:phosphatidylglycerol:prolipoprotein diacylglycerol transferase